MVWSLSSRSEAGQGADIAKQAQGTSDGEVSSGKAPAPSRRAAPRLGRRVHPRWGARWDTLGHTGSWLCTNGGEIAPEAGEVGRRISRPRSFWLGVAWCPAPW